MEKRYTAAITYGTFDLFHVGHLRLLQRIRAMSERLVVAVSTDEFNASKGKHSLIPYEHRCEIVGALSCVDQVIPERNWEQKRADITSHGVDLLVMGGDWKGRFDDLADVCDVLYLERTAGISSSYLREFLGRLPNVSPDEIQAALGQLKE